MVEYLLSNLIMLILITHLPNKRDGDLPHGVAVPNVSLYHLIEGLRNTLKTNLTKL